MKENKLTEGSNMRWESMRMMLPEHKSALVDHMNKTLYRRPPKPDLDEQQKENINRTLNESKQLRMPAKFLLYDPYEELEVNGVVERIDMYTKTFVVEGERFKIEDIVSAEMQDDNWDAAE